MSPTQALHDSGAMHALSATLPPEVLAPLAEINLQCIELLCAMAVDDHSPLPVVRELAPLWRHLSAESRRLMALCPFLLADAGFSEEARWLRWRGLPTDGLRPASPQPPPVAARTVLPPALARRVLTYGWHLARAHPSVARVSLGMTPVCLSQVAALGLHEIDQLCEQHPGWVRPRWEARPDVWRALLQAVARPSPEALRRVALRGIQLLAGAALAPQGTPR